MPAFFDTNVLIHSVDTAEAGKYGLAVDLVRKHLVLENGAISVQVLCEFYSASRKIDDPLSDEKARRVVERLSAFGVLPEDADTVTRAVRRHQETSFSFWDALRSGADRLFTEDMRHGQITEGMRIENPFLEDAE